MRSLKERINRIEKQVYSKYNHYGLFVVIIKDGIHKTNNINEDITFKTMQELEEYILNNYKCEQYNFITINFDIIGQR